MKAIVAGGRNFVPEEKHERWLVNHLLGSKVSEVVCGMARGADLFGKEVAKNLGIPVKEFPADWSLNGKYAGILRNKEMAEYSKGGICILFPGGRGTDHMREEAHRKGLEVIEWYDKLEV